MPTYRKPRYFVGVIGKEAQGSMKGVSIISWESP